MYEKGYWPPFIEHRNMSRSRLVDLLRLNCFVSSNFRLIRRDIILQFLFFINIDIFANDFCIF